MPESFVKETANTDRRALTRAAKKRHSTSSKSAFIYRATSSRLSVLYSGQKGGENDKTLFFLTSVAHHWGWERRLEALQELLSHHTEKEGDGRWILCLSWQGGTVAMAQIAQAPRKRQRAAGRQGRKRQRLGQCGDCCSCPCPRPHTQTANVPACHQESTDGLLQGGCGCDADLRVKVALFARAHIHIHTTAQQNNTFTFSLKKKPSLPTVKYNTWEE